jgi:AcrR family transcriptional regulator
VKPDVHVNLSTVAVVTTSIKSQLRKVKRERILAEALHLFYTNGYHGTSLDAIAEAMQVTKPFVYGVYDKKVDILFEIYLQSVHGSLDAVEGGAASNGSVSDRLAEVARRLTRVCIEHRDAVAVFFREQNSLEPEQLKVIAELTGRFDDTLTHLIEEGAKVGEFNLLDARTSTLAIGGMISWSYVWYRPCGRLSIEELMDQMAQYALRIVGSGQPK